MSICTFSCTHGTGSPLTFAALHCNRYSQEAQIIDCSGNSLLLLFVLLLKGWCGGVEVFCACCNNIDCSGNLLLFVFVPPLLCCCQCLCLMFCVTAVLGEMGEKETIGENALVE